MKDLLKHIGENYEIGMSIFMVRGSKRIENFELLKIIICTDKEFKPYLNFVLKRDDGVLLENVSETLISSSKKKALKTMKEALEEELVGVSVKIQDIEGQINLMER